MPKRSTPATNIGIILFVIVCIVLVLLYNTPRKSRHARYNRNDDDTHHELIDPRDNDVWSHIYHNDRLKVLKGRLTVTGVIERVRKEEDGDDHILLHLDAGQDDLLNATNLSEQHGDLVIEPICVNKITQEDAKEPCRGYYNNVTIPEPGERVSVTGTYVLDMEHGWNEIHPIVSIVPAGSDKQLQ